MKTPEEKKIEIWEHLIKQKDKIPSDINQNEINNIKDLIWNDDSFWMDVVNGHSLIERSPEELKKLEINIYDHHIKKCWERIKRKLKLN